MNWNHLMADRFAYGFGWSTARRAALERDGYVCQGEGSHSGRLSVHHIVPRRHGGRDDLANLTTFCRRHHEMAEAAIREVVIALPGSELRPKILAAASARAMSPIDWLIEAIEVASARDLISASGPTNELDDEITDLLLSHAYSEVITCQS